MMDNSLPIIIDRSRITDFEHCMRQRYWRYERDGRGIDKGGEWLDPLIGTAVHNGIEYSLRNGGVEESVAFTKETILSARRRGPISVFRPGLDEDADIAEAMDLAEALVRGWISVRRDTILRDFEIISIEKEMTYDYACEGRVIRQLSRPDIIHRRHSDGAVFIRNLKTVSRVDDKWRSKWRYDMQTFSEALAVEAELGEPVAGTIMEGLVKGSRTAYPRGSGDYHWDSPLIQGWKRDGEPPMTEDQWYGRYEWTCTGPHQISRGKDCPGNRNHKLSGVHRARVAERLGGISGWISYLAVAEPEVLAEQFVELTPILRSPYEIERWKRQKLPLEVGIREHRDHLMSLDPDDPTREALLDRWFPMSTADGNCVWPSQCEYFGLCHGTESDDLEGNGYKPRDFNHPTERDYRDDT